MLISERIAQIIEKMLNESNGMAEIQRNDFANRIGCVPSQINYVISSRFGPQNGYIVESRRGGGGYIKITRVRVDRNTFLMHLLGMIGSEVDAARARAFVSSMAENGVIDENGYKLFGALLSDGALSPIQDKANRDEVRAELLRTIILNII